LIRPVIEIKPIERNALGADGDDDQVLPYLPIESIAVHAQVVGRISKSHEPRQMPKCPSMNRIVSWAGHATRVGKGRFVSNTQAFENVGFLQQHR